MRTSARAVETSVRDSPAVASADPTRGREEAYRTLLGLLAGKTGAIPPELLTSHLLDVTAGADWPVVRAAGEALLRRLRFAQTDQLRIAARPARAEIFGIYATRRARTSSRPYTTQLRSLEPFRGSCDCPDFLRNSLGLCKHLLVVLEDLHAHPRRVGRQRREHHATLVSLGNGAQRNGRGERSIELLWDPIRPLKGEGDWLERVTLHIGGREQRRELPRPLRRWFSPAPAGRGRSMTGRNGRLVLAAGDGHDPKRRLALVEDLLAFLGANGHATAARPLGDPALLALLRDEASRLRMPLWRHERSGALRRALKSLKLPLYAYQLEGVDRLLANGRLLLADDMGLGKTAQAIAACHVLWAAGEVQRGLLVVPAPLKPQWLCEWRRFTPAPCEIVDGSRDDRRSVFRKTHRGFLVVNYEQVIRDLDCMLAWKPQIVILDEAQRIKNWATKTAACIKAFDPPYRLVLTGTPMENRLDELASLFDWVDSFALEPKWRLAPLHSSYADGKPAVRGARGLETLRARLSNAMLRRKRTEVLKDLPARTDTTVPVELTAEQKEEHDALAQPIAALLRIADRRPLTHEQFLRLMSLLSTQRIIANGLAQYRFAEVWPQIAEVRRPSASLLAGLWSPKLLELREILSALVLEQERKVVVFSQWRRMLMLADWAVRPLLAGKGLRAVFFTGQESQKRRTQNIVDFHDDPSTRVLFASDAGGVGLNLQRAASACVNLELPWNPAVLEQRIGRIYRLGQSRPIDVYNLVSSDSIESRIAQLVADKRALFQSLFDGTTDAVEFERSGSFIERLRQIVTPIAAPPKAAKPEPVDEYEDSAEQQIESAMDACDEHAELGTGSSEQALGREASSPAMSSDDRGGTSVAVDIAGLFSRLSVRHGPDGRMQLEAAADDARALAALFEGMGKLLRASAG